MTGQGHVEWHSLPTVFIIWTSAGLKAACEVLEDLEVHPDAMQKTAGCHQQPDCRGSSDDGVRSSDWKTGRPDAMKPFMRATDKPSPRASHSWRYWLPIPEYPLFWIGGGRVTELPNPAHYLGGAPEMTRGDEPAFRKDQPLFLFSARPGRRWSVTLPGKPRRNCEKGDIGRERYVGIRIRTGAEVA